MEALIELKELAKKFNSAIADMEEFIRPHISFEFSLIHLGDSNFEVLCEELAISVKLRNILGMIEEGIPITLEYFEKHDFYM